MRTRNIAEPVRKSFEIKDATLEDNQIAGKASVTGNLDLYNDVIFPGAWGPCLKAFKTAGFVTYGHNTRILPVAMPVSIAENGNSLHTLAEFHSHQAAQDTRSVCMERLAKNLSVGLSVGFMLDYGDDDDPSYLFFESGKGLLNFAKANGYDMSLFDSKTIKAHDGWCCGILKISQLIEYAVTPCPANQSALATDAKGWRGMDISTIETERDFEGFLRDAGFSRKDATAISLHGYKATQRDAGDADADGDASESEIEAKDADGAGGDRTDAEADKAKIEDRDALQSLALRALSARASAARLYLPA